MHFHLGSKRKARPASSYTVEKQPLCSSCSHIYADFSRPRTGTCRRTSMGGLMSRRRQEVWPLSAQSPSASRNGFLCSGLNSNGRAGQERPSFLSIWSCCYPGNSPSGLQGLITFLKVFRGREFWNDYRNVASWGQSSAGVTPCVGSWAREETNTAKRRRKCSPWSRKTLGAQNRSCRTGNFYASLAP